MLVRVVRTISGTLLLLVGIPLLLAGGGLWFAMQHQDPTGGYAATLSTVTSEGYAVVTSDVDGLLRREVPFARGGRTTVELTATTPEGPAFLGLAPAEAVASYLADVPYTRVDEVRLARGPLPVVTTEVAGEAEPATPPQQQSFWLTRGHAGTVSWAAEDLRGQQVALVVMSPRGEAPLRVEMVARVHPHWLGSTMVGALLLGTLLTLVAVALLVWPHRSRQVVYVVPPAEVPQVAARLGVPMPRATSESGGPAVAGVDALEAPTEVALGRVVAQIPLPDGAATGGSGDPGKGPGGEPDPHEEEEEEPSLDTLPITDQAPVATGAVVPVPAPAVDDRLEAELAPEVTSAAVDAAEPSGAGGGGEADAGQATEDADAEESGPENQERAGAEPADAASVAGAAEGVAPRAEVRPDDEESAPAIVPATIPGGSADVAVWEWPPLVQQPTASPSPVRPG